MSDELEPRFSTALRLRDEDRLREAREILSELATEFPSAASVWLMLGHVYWKLDGLEAAIPHFSRATELAPKMELASLGLFHALWESGRRDDAFEEARRFVALAGPSTEYARLLDEMNPAY